MEQEDIANDILHWIPTIDFTRTPVGGPVSLFETTIRHIGALLGSYDLLKGPFAHLKVRKDEVDALLAQAVVLANSLRFAFDTPTGIPYNVISLNHQIPHPKKYTQDSPHTAGLAELGSLVLEWQHLSDLTGDPSYGELAQRAERYFLEPSAEVWPGLTGSSFSMATGDILDAEGGWGSGNDSAYEYLIKMAIYDPARYENYSKRFQAAADSTIQHLVSHPASRPDLSVAGDFSGQTVYNQSSQLACFMGGAFILGSTVLERPEYLEYGLKFSEFCANGYRHAASGIGPTAYSWNATDFSKRREAHVDLFTKAGWFISEEGGSINGQTPEAVESWYYAYQVTGNQYWRDVAWAYTLAQTACIVGSGFSNVINVLAPDGGRTGDYTMASFLLAETLKYEYLIQTERKGVWDVEYAPNGAGKGGNVNMFVYNTEAHPFRVVH